MSEQSEIPRDVSGLPALMSDTTDPCAKFPHEHSGFAEYGCAACDCYESEALNADGSSDDR